MKEKIKELLGLGLPNGVVASAVGVSDAYVSQLLSEDIFAKEVQELRLVNLSEHATRDKKWNSLEDSLLKKLEELMEFGGFTRPIEVLRALQVVNGAKRRAAPQEFAATAQQNVVPLILPIVLAPKFILNSQGQVVEVEGRVIATMPANIVNETLKASKGKQLEQDDASRARGRLDNLQKLELLPVHELI